VLADEQPSCSPPRGLGSVRSACLTSVTLQVEPAFLLRAVEQPMPLDEVLDGFDDLVPRTTTSSSTGSRTPTWR
jgi:hypothetical protein